MGIDYRNVLAQQRFQDKAASIDAKLNDARSKINWDRRKKAEKDPVTWINTYCLGILLDDPPPSRGKAIIREMWDALNDKIRPYMVLQSRGSGKTSYVECVVMMAIATGIHNYVVLISQNATSAQNLLNDIFGMVLEPSAFSEDYPDLCFPFQMCNGSYRRKQSYLGVQTDIQKCASKLVFPRLKNPDGTEVLTSSACIETRGISGGIRGMKHGTKRPTCVILDDIQDDETAQSQEQVEKLLSIINKSVLNLGGKGKISVLQTATPICPDDLVEVISKDKNWKTTKFPAIIKWPKDYIEDKKNGLWSQYFKIYDEENTTDSKHSKSLAFYRQHKKEMDEGSEVLNPKRYKRSDGHISALQALMEKKHQIGDSAFFSEFQMEPKKFDYVVDITPRKIFLKNNKLVHSMVVPDGFLTTYLTADLNTSYGITYDIVCYKPDSTCVVIAHGIHKCQIDQALNELQYNQAVYGEISKFIKHIKTLNIKIDGIGIDAGGKNFNVVCEFCKNCNSLFGIPAIAMAGRACTNFNPLVKSRLRNAVGRTVLCGDDREHVKSFSGNRYMFFDSDFFKEAVQKSLLAEVGAPGGCTLYNGINIEHSDFAQQICNEILRFKKIKSNGQVEYVWRSREPHDHLDTMAMNYAIACSNGISAEQQIVEQNLTKEQRYRLLLLKKRKKIRIV